MLSRANWIQEKGSAPSATRSFLLDKPESSVQKHVSPRYLTGGSRRPVRQQLYVRKLSNGASKDLPVKRLSELNWKGKDKDKSAMCKQLSCPWKYRVAFTSVGAVLRRFSRHVRLNITLHKTASLQSQQRNSQSDHLGRTALKQRVHKDMQTGKSTCDTAWEEVNDTSLQDYQRPRRPGLERATFWVPSLIIITDYYSYSLSGLKAI